MPRKTYTVVYKKDEDGVNWNAHVVGVKGCLSYGASIDIARSNIREALCLCIGDDAGEKATLVDDIREDQDS